jgi:hypothetical protein
LIDRARQIFAERQAAYAANDLKAVQALNTEEGSGVEHRGEGDASDPPSDSFSQVANRQLMNPGDRPTPKAA